MAKLNQETKNKLFNLSIGDTVSIAVFFISVGITIGYYKSTLDKIQTIENDIDKISNNIGTLKENCASYKTSLEDIKSDLNIIKKLK